MSTSTSPSPATDPDETVSGLVFDPSALFPGDVVLERSGGKESDVITMVDGGNFSHVLIHLGAGEFMEAIDGGSRSISFLRLPIVEPARWLLLRYVGAGKMSRFVAEDAALHARNLAHMPYNLRGAIRSVTPAALQPTTALFCSELVAEAYLRAGVEVESGIPPQKTTPRIFERSGRFTAITPLPMMQGASPAGDRGAAYAATPMNEENQLVQVVYAQIMAEHAQALQNAALAVGGEARTLYDLFAVLAVADEQVAKTIAQQCHEMLMQGGYYGFLSESRKLETLSRASQAPDFLVATWREGLWRHGANYAAFSEIAERRPWPLWEAMRDMYGSHVIFFERLISLAKPG